MSKLRADSPHDGGPASDDERACLVFRDLEQRLPVDQLNVPLGL